jgi:hypothetical protein
MNVSLSLCKFVLANSHFTNMTLLLHQSERGAPLRARYPYRGGEREDAASGVVRVRVLIFEITPTTLENPPKIESIYGVLTVKYFYRNNSTWLEEERGRARRAPPRTLPYRAYSQVRGLPMGLLVSQDLAYRRALGRCVSLFASNPCESIPRTLSWS